MAERAADTVTCDACGHTGFRDERDWLALSTRFTEDPEDPDNSRRHYCTERCLIGNLMELRTMHPGAVSAVLDAFEHAGRALVATAIAEADGAGEPCRVLAFPGHGLRA